LLGHGRWREEFADFGSPVSKKYYHYSGPSHVGLNKLWICPDMELPGLAPGCQQRWLLGRFEKKIKKRNKERKRR